MHFVTLSPEACDSFLSYPYFLMALKLWSGQVLCGMSFHLRLSILHVIGLDCRGETSWRVTVAAQYRYTDLEVDSSGGEECSSLVSTLTV